MSSTRRSPASPTPSPPPRRVKTPEAHAPDDVAERDGPLHLPTRRKARLDGFDLDAQVCVKAHDRPRLEALCRYLLRPPLLDRLKILGRDLVAIELKRPWSNGATHVSMSVRTCLTRLAALVPRPRAPEFAVTSRKYEDQGSGKITGIFESSQPLPCTTSSWLRGKTKLSSKA